MKLSLEAARGLLVTAQGLADPPPPNPTRDDVLAAIRCMGVLQIDTIHVVARSPYLVLWSRLGDYEPRWLDDLLAERRLFEYWSHEQSFLPIEDYPLHRRLMLDGVKKWVHTDRWLAEHPDVVEIVLRHIDQHGEARSSDFERSDGQKGNWWDWKDEKMALDLLHTRGDLMIARRHNFQRIYAHRSRIVPDWADEQAPPLAEVQRTLALKAVKALGAAPAAWVPDYFRLPKKGMDVLLADLAKAGDLLTIEIEGIGKGYLHPDHAERAAALTDGAAKPTLTTLLSPFDPIVWDRKRARQLFNFDYTIECYTPAPKRKYGYFVLPILRRGELVGRLDAKAHRKDGIFEVKALYFEVGTTLDDALLADVSEALRRCAAWHGTPQVVVRRTDPAGLEGVFGA